MGGKRTTLVRQLCFSLTAVVSGGGLRARKQTRDSGNRPLIEGDLHCLLKFLIDRKKLIVSTATVAMRLGGASSVMEVKFLGRVIDGPPPRRNESRRLRSDIQQRQT